MLTSEDNTKDGRGHKCVNAVSNLAITKIKVCRSM